MGKGRDKRRKQKGSSAAGQGLAKTERKTIQNEKKLERRIDRQKEEEEEDFDALIEKFKLEDERKNEVWIEEDCEPPSVRVHASYTPLPEEKSGVVMVFGGEYEDQQDKRVRTFNDLFKFQCEKQKWTKINTPNSPEPRSSHQMVYYKQMLYLFGGEFTSPKQDRFKHFKDLWRLDLNVNMWEKLAVRNGPSARSGHRAAIYQNKMFVFGGFNDSGDIPIYYNDLWMLDLDNLLWEAIIGRPGDLKPSPRSGFRMMIHGDFLFIYGGYSRARNSKDVELEHGKTMDDMWSFHLKTQHWVKIKKNGIAPTTRSGFNMCLHQHRAILFGGATDHEAKKGESIVSEFHNDLFQFHFERQKWYTVNLRPSKNMRQSCTQDTAITAAAAQLAQEEEKYKKHKAAVKIQSSYRGYAVRKAFKVYRLGNGTISELLYSPATYGMDLSVLNAPKPRGRISSGLCVVKNDLWLFGGIVEIMDQEVTLDDIWCLSLKNYDGWQCVHQNSVGDDVFRQEFQHSEDESSEDGS